jgi:hypothetical protein
VLLQFFDLLLLCPYLRSVLLQLFFFSNVEMGGLILLTIICFQFQPKPNAADSRISAQPSFFPVALAQLLSLFVFEIHSRHALASHALPRSI